MLPEFSISPAQNNHVTLLKQVDSEKKYFGRDHDSLIFIIWRAEFCCTNVCLQINCCYFCNINLNSLANLKMMLVFISFWSNNTQLVRFLHSFEESLIFRQAFAGDYLMLKLISYKLESYMESKCIMS
jgi:hypothetical protein